MKLEAELPKIFFRGKGCKSCNGTGYRGRMGIFEAFEVNEDIRKVVISPDFSLDNLIATAKKRGMIGMFEDGLRKSFVGMTTVEEVLRVIKE